MLFIETIEYLCGERKFLSGEVIPLDENEVVVINNAKYELTCCGSALVLESGECEISQSDKSKYQLLLGIDETGCYDLTLTLEIGRETVKKKVNIRVR